PPRRQRVAKEDTELYDLLMTRNKDVAECCEHIRFWLQDKHSISLRKNDISFLAMHITKILEGIEKK
ncbi:MAG: hypothetical protein LBF60_01375, partial [Treponema sp.]|nr:hypothetical protein [Treponema sp.]